MDEDAVQRLREVAKSSGRGSRSGKHAQRLDVEKFKRLYERRKRELYDAAYRCPRHGTHEKHLATTVRKLAKRGLTNRHFDAFLDHAIEVTPKATRGNLAFPPPSFLHKDWIVDSYLQNCVGEREPDFDNARRMLKRRGLYVDEASLYDVLYMAQQIHLGSIDMEHPFVIGDTPAEKRVNSQAISELARNFEQVGHIDKEKQF